MNSGLRNVKSYFHLARTKLGTYIQAKIASESKKEIYKLAKSLNLPGLIHPNTYHITIAYSRVPLNTYKTREITSPIKVKAVGFELFAKNSLVLVLESKFLESRFNYSRKLGATWDYDGYTPHITIAQDPGLRDVDLKKLEKEVDLNKLRIYITKEVKQKMNPDS